MLKNVPIEHMLLHLNLAPNQSMYFYRLIILLSTFLFRLQNLKTTQPNYLSLHKMPIMLSSFVCDFGFWSIIYLNMHRNNRSICLFTSLLLNSQHRLQSPHNHNYFRETPLSLLIKNKKEKAYHFSK